ENPNLALIDAFQLESFREFMEESDIELVVVDRGDGTQAHIQALSLRSVNQVLRRIIKRCEESGVDLKKWICDKDEFDLCRKLDLPIGERMRQLDEFFRYKRAQAAIIVVDVLLAILAPPTFGLFLTLLAVLGWLNNYFLELCDCSNRV
ncbi:hypothetical protein, partial [Rhodonellum sp.]|uniref:hypothetical protein n=1 Tax=Rhodonellum sp. TaxID=2231180 RepID=UPI00271A0E45